MNIPRMKRALEILQKVPEGKFNLSVWAQLTRDEAIKYKGKKVALNGCGTAGCALGWIASDPRCNKEGLHLWLRDGDSVYPTVIFKDWEDDDAAREYFDLTQEQTHWLFIPTAYKETQKRDSKAVMRRMAALIVAEEEHMPDRIKWITFG